MAEGPSGGGARQVGPERVRSSCIAIGNELQHGKAVHAGEQECMGNPIEGSGFGCRDEALCSCEGGSCLRWSGTPRLHLALARRVSHESVSP